MTPKLSIKLLYERAILEYGMIIEQTIKSNNNLYEPLLFKYVIDDLLRANEHYEKNGLRLTRVNISILKEIANLTSFSNLVAAAEQYDSLLNLFKICEFKNSYLHSMVLFEYAIFLTSKYTTLKKRDSVLEIYQQSLKIRKKLLGLDHPKTKIVLSAIKNFK